MTDTTSLSRWPPAEGLSTPIVARKDAILTTSASISVSAPAQRVFDLLLSTTSYREWNTWVPRVSIQSQPEGVPHDSTDLAVDTKFTFHVIMDERNPGKVFDTGLRITDISTPANPSSYIPQEVLDDDPTYTADLSTIYRVSWKTEGGWINAGMQAERFHEIIVVGENECEVRTWEVMGGVLARTVKWMMAKTLDEKFVLWVTSLKKAAEAPQGSST
ncbi:hypothetical protein P152DRAFT_454796 [Eremomyces bilateralis CBS 781.70]|uniref:Polyketide cyclase/dehydrase n=1 Tax=Eremomyces bilateralis CBS 781.70 TaxID=1392243 RepID=A0A6G1GFB9_9PEZI|nr:uncharacterized protein P152DRAFT_454796 [Eremomyces bilateralis CBS 781.70]KAF1816550.1 hypothetical protein P152DRAFT_454796 [Eremomyces bilateralis CBS 781.70]